MEKPHKRLDAWKLAIELAVRTYRQSESLPREEKYGLIGQMRRAAVSVPCNIAEGAARQTRKEFANFLHIAQGSLSELDTLFELALRLEYFQPTVIDDLDPLMERLDKTISGLIRRQRKFEEENEKGKGGVGRR